MTDPTSAVQIAATQRKHRAMELRKQGHNFAEIGRIMAVELSNPAYDRRQAHRDVQDVLKQLAEENRENGERVVAGELMRLDDLHKAWWGLAIGESVDKSERELVDQQINALNESMRIALDRLQDDSITPLELKALADAIRSTAAELNRHRERSKPNRDAAELILRIMERRARLLGLDKMVVLREEGPKDVTLVQVVNQITNMPNEDLERLMSNLSAAGVAPGTMGGIVIPGYESGEGDDGETGE